LIIPKTAKKERLRENIDVYSFKLSDEDYQAITNLNIDARFYNP